MPNEEIGYKSTNKICRLCLKSCENSIPIFDANNMVMEKTLKECVEDVGRISLSPLDNLPETICQPCHKQISEMYTFVMRIRKNDEFLHNILQCDYDNDDYSNDVKEDDSSSMQNTNQSFTLDSNDQDELTDENPPSTVTNYNDFVAVGANRYENCISEEGELPQYIEIAYVRPDIVDENPSDITTQNHSINSNNDPIQCSYCLKTFANIRYKRDHERGHFEDGRKCPYCERRFLKKCDWTRHVNSHTLEKTFECETCCRVFFSLAELNRHLKVHNPAREHKCDYCNSEFKNITALKFHIRTVHLKERPYCCPICGSAFSTASKVRRHQKSKICSETKLVTTVHRGCDKFLIVEKNFQGTCVEDDRDGGGQDSVIIEYKTDLCARENLDSFVTIEHNS